MKDVVWVFSGVLAVLFLVTGITKLFLYERARKSFSWVKDVPRSLTTAIGVIETVSAIGLIVPVATGLHPELTTFSAATLFILMLGATNFHVYRHESDEAFLSGLLMLLAAFVTYLRWPLLA